MSTEHDNNAVNYERLYYYPRELILHLECRPHVKSQEVHAAIDHIIGINAVDPWNKLQWIKEFQGLDPVLYFDDLSDDDKKTFILVPLEMVDPKATQEEFGELIKEIYKDKDLVKLSDPKEDRGKYGGKEISNDIILKYVYPNWFMAATHHQGSGGGPGGAPCQVANPPVPMPRFSFPKVDPILFDPVNSSSDVHVAILDTAPNENDFTHARSDIVWYPEHSFKPWLDQPMDIDYAICDPLRRVCFRRLTHFSLLDQHYEMPDHGLFVSGIVHTIAKKATLHLYEVLNRFGLGTFYTVAQALSKILERDIGRPLIISCSLVLDLPQDGKNSPDFLINIYNNLIIHTTESMQMLFTGIAKLHRVIVVAAAGNDNPVMRDRRSNQPLNTSINRPKACYPAAFAEVIGVGALQKNIPLKPHNLTSYSNFSESDYYTLGGEPGEINGVLGVYICKFPINLSPTQTGKPAIAKSSIQYSSNNTGWAWWCGTSFAAPIISGLLAVWWGRNILKRAKDAKVFLDQNSTQWSRGSNTISEIEVTQN